MAKEKAVAGGLKSLFTKAAPAAVTKIPEIGAAAKGGGIVKGAVVGAGLKAGEEAVGAFKDPGFILFITGLLTFIFNEYLGNVIIAVFLAAAFMLFSAYFIFQRKGLVVTIIFGIWYIFLGGITDPRLLMYYIGPILIIGMLAHGLFNKLSKRSTFAEGASGELIGLIPVLFFFLDLGLIPLLVEKLNLPLTSLVQNIILFTPWWAFLGLFTTKKENVFITIARVVGIIYIISILTFGIAPEAYGAYKSAIPGPEELLKAKEEIKEKIPEKENPLISNFACTWEAVGKPGTDITECVKKRQEESELKAICKGKDLKPKTSAFNKCLEEEKEKKKKAALQIAGTEDPTIKEPTTAEFKINEEYFPKKAYQSIRPYPAQLEIKNPRELHLNIDLDCFFKKGKENITGTPEPQGFTLTKKEDTKSITCTPDQNLNGSYTLVYQANIYNMSTLSRLTRLFVGDVSEKTKEEINELKSTYVPGKKYLSQAPKEFARINFGFGEPETNPVIEHDDKPLLISTIENIGKGKILAIKSYHLDLEIEGITPKDSWECFSGTGKQVTLPKTKTTFKETIPLTSCFLNLPYDLIRPEEFILKEFTAILNYDYQIEKEIKIEVKIIET